VTTSWMRTEAIMVMLLVTRRTQQTYLLSRVLVVLQEIWMTLAMMAEVVVVVVAQVLLVVQFHLEICLPLGMAIILRPLLTSRDYFLY
jgi:hypothetical protein